MDHLEKNLNYRFKDPSLLKMALTHPSALAPGHGVAFERLEFLGDRVLGLVIASWLFEAFPHENEGNMAVRFSTLVRKEALLAVAKEIDLGNSMVIKQEKSSSQKKRLETLFADGCEALIGALYLDGGLEAARAVIHFLWQDHLQSNQEISRDPKSVLQEWAQGQGKQHPIYTVISSSGPAHAPHFIMEVNVKGFTPIQGEGASKRAAEKEAAKRFLESVSVHE